MTYLVDEFVKEKTYTDELEMWLERDFKNVLTKEQKAESHKVKKKCFHCGKEFYIKNGCTTQYNYKESIRGKLRYFCSWTCLSRNRKARQNNE